MARVAPRDEEEGVWVDVYISDGKTGITEGEYNWRVKRVRLESGEAMMKPEDFCKRHGTGKNYLTEILVKAEKNGQWAVDWTLDMYLSQSCKVCGYPYDRDLMVCDETIGCGTWYHAACVGLEAVPSGVWHCKDCTEGTSKQRK